MNTIIRKCKYSLALFQCNLHFLKHHVTHDYKSTSSSLSSTSVSVSHNLTHLQDSNCKKASGAGDPLDHKLTLIICDPVQEHHNIHQWRKLFCNAASKTSLIKFLVDGWKGPNKILYVTCEEVCFKVNKNQWEEVTQLKSSQEEADTCMLLHALHAAVW